MIEEIKRLRKEHGITQKQLAEMAGVTQAYIAKLEGGKVDPKYSTLKKIYDVLLNIENNVKRAKDVMTSPVVTVHPYESLSNAIYLMLKHDFSQLVVVRREKILGSISEKNLIRKIDIFQLAKYKDKQVYEFMEDPFPQVSKNESLESVLTLLKNNSAVVVEENGKPLGIITRSDVLGMLKVKG